MKRFIPLLLLIWATGCVEYPAIQEIKRVTVREYHDSTLVLETLVVLQNPNKQDIPLKAYSYDMRLYDSLIGAGADSNGLVLPGEDTLHVPLTTKLSLSSLETLFPKLVRDAEAQLEIDGHYTFRLLNKNWTLHQKTETPLKLDEILSGIMDGTAAEGGLMVEDLRLGEIGLLQTQVLMDIRLQNQLPLDYAIEGIRIDLYPNATSESSLGNWRKGDTLYVAQDSMVLFPVNFKLNNLALMSAVPELLGAGGDAQMEKMIIGGNIKIAIDQRRFTVPFRQPLGALIKQQGQRP